MSFFRKKRMLANMLALSLIVSSCSLSACDSFTGLFPIGGNTADSSLDESESNSPDISDSNDMGEGSSLGDNGNGDSTLDDSTGGTTDGENDRNDDGDNGEDNEN